MLVNSNEMLLKAKKNHYAVPHFNINNLEWTKYILEECNELNIPVILGVSEGAAKYMGGFNTIYKMTEGLIQDLNIKIPVCLHVDHAKSEKVCIAAIDAGFKSVMIDASIYKLEENILITKKVVDYAHKHNVSVEAEIGHIKEAKDNIEKMENATLEDCLKIVKETHIDSLAPALGSVHGLYKEEANLDFETMQKINDELEIPLVLHGGTGIEDEKIKHAIACGISKININTDLQVAWSKDVKKFIKENDTVYDPRKIIQSGEKAIKRRVREIVTLFGTKL